VPEVVEIAGHRLEVAWHVRGPCSSQLLPGCGHAPWRERPAETTAAVLALARAVL
jgi:pimeloyl-ACP methyl ester carboxylesterase